MSRCVSRKDGGDRSLETTPVEIGRRVWKDGLLGGGKEREGEDGLERSRLNGKDQLEKRPKKMVGSLLREHERVVGQRQARSCNKRNGDQRLCMEERERETK